jgi:hypothetical protein
MMRKLLSLMASCTPMALTELSQALGARLPEVEAMLGQLTELGYLQDLACKHDANKAVGCSGCTARNGCHVGAPQHLWTLTMKGRRAAGMHPHQVSASPGKP